MFSTSINNNITANTKTANILSGDINEFVASDSLVNIFCVSSASGVRIAVNADSDVAIDDKEIPFIGTTLDKSAHLLDSFAVAGGTRLSATLRETAGVSTSDVITGVEVIPLG